MVKKPRKNIDKVYYFKLQNYARNFQGELVAERNPELPSQYKYSVIPEGSEHKIPVFFRGKDKLTFDGAGNLVQRVNEN